MVNNHLFEVVMNKNKEAWANTIVAPHLPFFYGTYISGICGLVPVETVISFTSISTVYSVTAKINCPVSQNEQFPKRTTTARSTVQYRRTNNFRSGPRRRSAHLLRRVRPVGREVRGWTEDVHPLLELICLFIYSWPHTTSIRSYPQRIPRSFVIGARQSRLTSFTNLSTVHIQLFLPLKTQERIS